MLHCLVDGSLEVSLASTSTQDDKRREHRACRHAAPEKSSEASPRPAHTEEDLPASMRTFRNLKTFVKTMGSEEQSEMPTMLVPSWEASGALVLSN